MEKELIWPFRESSHGNFKFFNKGGQHIILEDPYFAQIAQECNMPELRQVSRFNFREYIHRYRTLPRNEHLTAAKEFAEVQNNRFARLKEVFDLDIPNQTTIVQNVFLGKEHLEYIWSHYEGIPDGLYPSTLDQAGWIVVTVQDMLRDLQPDDLALRVPYAERNGTNKEFYSEVSARWLTNPWEPPTEEEIRQFHAVQPSEELLELLADCTSNTLREEKVIDVVDKMVVHAILTDEPIDISGKGNIYISADGQLWAPDILFPMPQPILRLLPNIVMKIQNNFGPTCTELNFLINGLGYIRSVNYLAALYERPDRILYFQDLDIEPQTWNKIHDLLTELKTFKELHADTELYDRIYSSF